MKRILITALAATLCTAMWAAPGKAAAKTQPAETDTLSVAVGISLGRIMGGSIDRLASLGVTVDPDVFISMVEKVLKGEATPMTAGEADAWLDNYIRSTRPDDLPDSFTPESQEAFLKEVSGTEGAVTTPDGLVFIVLTEGEGPMPVDGQHVKLKYRGTFSDGTVFDATGSPIEFGVNEVTPGFSEGLKMMRPGGKYRIVMPASLGYGAEGIPGAIPGNAALDFTVELIEVK